MSSGGPDPKRRPGQKVDTEAPLALLRFVASAAAALLAVAVLALIFAPKDPGTLTLYGLVIGINLLLFLGFWPLSKWLRRLGR